MIINNVSKNNQNPILIHQYITQQSMSNSSIQNLKTKINTKNINNITYHYTICEKQGQTIGLISHKRMLVLNQNDGILYYVAEPEKDKDNLDQLISKPKKQVINFNLSVVKNEPKTKKLQVIYNKKSDKDKIVVGEWKFLMDNQQVAQDWANLVKQKKNQRTAKALGMSNIKQAGMFNDIVTFGMMQGPKQQKKQEQIKGQNISGSKQPQILDSSYNKNPREKPLTNSNIPQNNTTTTPPINTNTNPHTSKINQNINPSGNMERPGIRGPLTNETGKNDEGLIQSSRYDGVRKNNFQSRYPMQIRSNTAEQNLNKSTINTITNNNKINQNTNNQTNNNNNTKNSYHNPTNNINNSMKPETQKQKKPDHYNTTTNNTTANNTSPTLQSNNNKNNPSLSQPNSINKKPQDTTAKARQKQPTNNNEKKYPNNTNNYNNINSQDKINNNKNNSNNSFNNRNQGNLTKKSPKNTPAPYNQQKSKQIPQDWNYQFLHQHTQSTIKSYSDYALEVFMSLPPQNIILRAPTESKDQQIQPKRITKNGIRFMMAEIGTKASEKLQKQFNNYHYLLQSCRQNKFINVPLCCLIEYLGILCLAKAEFPTDVDIVQNLSVNNGMNMAIIQQLRNLQLYTKISSQAIKRSTYVLDLSRNYGTSQGLKRIYVDNLIDYLPTVPDHYSSFNEQVRPEIILDNFSKTMNSRVPQIQQQISKAIKLSIKQLSQTFSQHQIAISSYQDLKQILHSYGLNQSLLPYIYSQVQSRYVKRFLHTAMVSFIIKQQIQRSITDFRENEQLQHVEQVVQQAFRIYCQAAPNQRQYQEIWKTLAQEFKKKYRTSMNYSQIEPSFLLSSLMFIINGEYDIGKLDKKRKLFQENRIINRGFLKKLLPKVKLYYRFTTQKVQNVMNFCRKSTNHIAELNKIVPLNNPKQLTFLLLKQNSKKFYSYLSQYISPFNSYQYSKLVPQIYQSLNSQPPTLSSHEITINYAKHCLKTKRVEEYQKVIQKSMDIANYWLGQDHPLLCDIYQSLSDYYGNKGSYQDSINFMKQALTTCIRSTGTHTSRAGNQYFKLAQKQWKFGQKKDAIQNYNKAKANMQSLNQQNPSYPLLLNKMATAELNSGNLDKCILLAIKAIKSSQQKGINEINLIKIYQVLCRAYQLNKNKQQLKNLALLTAKVFNNSQNPHTFVQMVQISLIGFTINTLPVKQEKLQQYMKAAIKSNIGRPENRSVALQRLMKLSQNIIVMEKFAKGLQAIERYFNEGKLGRNQNFQSKQFKNLFQLILQAVGIDFFEGVLNQAKFW